MLKEVEEARSDAAFDDTDNNIRGEYAYWQPVGSSPGSPGPVIPFGCTLM
jgi:hypothetical protein